MELSIKTFVLFGAVVLTGLSAGFFYSWSVSVILGTQNISSPNYLETMQSINRAILNPWFYTIFFGSIVFLSVASVYEFHHNRISFWLMLFASILYLLGTIGVTGMGNVPLNNQLDALNIGELSGAKIEEFRTFYETKWNKLHLRRTICAVLSFLLAVLALFPYLKLIK